MLIYGKNVAEEYLKTGKKIKKTYILDSYNGKMNFPNIEIINKIGEQRIIMIKETTISNILLKNKLNFFLCNKS